TDSYYDPITKTTQKVTTAHSKTEETDYGTFTFRDGVIRLPYYETDDTTSGYTFRIKFVDPTNGHPYERSMSARKPNYSTYDPGTQVAYPELRVIREKEDKDQYAPFLPGEKASFEVINAGEVSTLFVYANADEILDVLVSAENVYTAAFEDKAIPMARLYVVSADREISAAAASFTYDLMYDYESLNLLNVEVKPEKTKALPGEEMDVTLVVTDLDGKPVRNAEVVLSVVDESCFALGAQTLDKSTPLQSIMAFRMPRGSINSFYRVFDFYALSGSKNGYAETVDGVRMMAKASAAMPAATTTAAMAMKDMTGGAMNEAANDPGYVREVFSDNPFFVTARTDSSGAAVVRCKMPDNITTWRLSAIASAREKVNETPVDVLLGAAKDAIVVTQPFFLTTTVGSVFITGDDISVGAKASGVGTFEDVALTAKLYDKKGTLLAERSAKALKDHYAQFNLGKVPAGDYTVLVSASADGYADNIRNAFTVIDSAILLRVNKIITPETAHALNPTLYPVTLSFYDGSNTLVGSAVSEIMRMRNNRTDSKAAYAAALLVCQNLWGAVSLYDQEVRNVLSELNASSGGWGIYDYAEQDPVVTAKILLLLADQLSYSRKEYAAKYLESAVTSSDDARTVAAALMGLAAADRPVLPDLNYMLAHFSEMNNATPAAKLYLSAAFAADGDAAAARKLYDEVAKDLRKTKDNETCFAGDTLEDTLALTYAALLSATLTNAEDAAELESYLVRRDSAYELYSLEHAIFAAAYAPTKYEPKTLKYSLNGEEKTLEIGRYSRCLSMNREEYESFKVISASDGILVRAMYWGTPEEADCLTAKDVTLTKSIAPVSGKPGFYRVTIRVSGKTDADSYYATLTDLLPTGSRFVRLEKSSFEAANKGVYGWIYESDGEMHGYVYVSNYQRPTTAGRSERSFDGTFTYVIRAYAKGEFVAESAYLIDTATNTAAISKRSKVVFD
ncbi:MAG: hypothetical protein IKQ87_08255, partial [Clostridia bacterium]|nr:hypothetical protein [Clostridia bacterium]